MDLNEYMDLFRPAIDAELKKTINTIDRKNYPELWEMLSYHMGWTGEGAGQKNTGQTHSAYDYIIILPGVRRRMGICAAFFCLS